MNRTWFAGLLTALSLAVVGCGQQQQAIDSNITVFHELPASVNGKTVAVVAHPPELNDSLEFKAYRPFVEKYLMQAGFEIVSRDNADYVALFSFGFDRRGSAQLASLSVSNDLGDAPVYVQSPMAGSRFDSVERRHASGGNGVYARNVSIDLVAATAGDPNPNKAIFKAHAVTMGACAGKPEVVHKMVAAIFEGFPGRSGATRIVQLPADANCRVSRL